MPVDHTLLLVQVAPGAASTLDSTLGAILPLAYPDAIDGVRGVLTEINTEDVMVNEASYLITVGGFDSCPILDDIILGEQLV